MWSADKTKSSASSVFLSVCNAAAAIAGAVFLPTSSSSIVGFFTFIDNTEKFFWIKEGINKIIDEAQNKYKQDGWIYLDWTCDECEFGEVPWSNQERYYLEVP